MLSTRRKAKVSNLTIPTTKDTLDTHREGPSPAPVQDQPFFKEQYRQNYVKANWLSRITLHYGYALLSSVNKNGGKLEEGFLEEMELKEGELDAAVNNFKNIYQDNLKKQDITKKPVNQ